jgi:hypothetical protein
MAPKVVHGEYLPRAVPVETDWDHAEPRPEIRAVRRIEQAPLGRLPRPMEYNECLLGTSLEETDLRSTNIRIQRSFCTMALLAHAERSGSPRRGGPSVYAGGNTVYMARRNARSAVCGA